MKLATARNLTKSSPVASIKNLAAWYDSVPEESFDDWEEGNGLSITNWYDVNPQSSLRHNMASATSKATYTTGAINGLPALYFSGVDGNGYNNTSLAIEGEVTIFAVATNEESGSTFRRILQSNTDGYFFFGIGATSDRQFATFYGSGSAWNHTGSFGSDAALGLKQGYVLSATENSAGVNIGYVNGVSVSSPVVSPEIKAKSIGVKISNYNGQCWRGYIAEIIVFDRALLTSERRDIEQYLGKKWGIKVS